MAQDAFRKSEEEYFRLRGQFATGRMTREQFEAALNELMVQDAQGRYWMLGVDSGKWYVHQGNNWVEANPFGTIPTAPMSAPPRDLPERRTGASPPSPPSSPAPRSPSSPTTTPQKGGIGCGGCLVRSCLLLIILIAVLAGGAYLALQSGMLTTTNLLKLAGLGPGMIEVDNFRDDPVRVNIEQAEVGDDSMPLQGTLELASFDVKTWRAPSSGRYKVEFSASGSTSFATCMLTIGSGDQFQFVALPEQLLVNRSNRPSETNADLFAATSRFCR